MTAVSFESLGARLGRAAVANAIETTVVVRLRRNFVQNLTPPALS